MNWTPPNKLKANRKDRRRAQAVRRSSSDGVRLQAAKNKLPSGATRKPTLNSAARMQLTAAAVITDGELGAFEIEAYTGGEMRPQLMGMMYDGPVVVDIAGVIVDGDIPVHREHDRQRPVGHATVTLGNRIVCNGVFSIVSDDSEEIRASGKNGFPWRGSIGLSNMRYEFVELGQTATANGQTFNGPLLMIRASKLDEVSFVTIAGDPTVRPAIVASQSAGVLEMNFAAWLAALGLDEATITDAQKTALLAKFDAEMQAEADAVASADDAATVVDEDAVVAAAGIATSTASRAAGTGLRAARVNAQLQAARDQAANEEDRIAAIREIGSTIGNPIITEAAANGATLVAHAIREGWDAGRTALYATRSGRPRVAAIHTNSPAERGSIAALQAAIMLRANRAIDRVVPTHHMVPAWQSRPVNDSERQRVMDSAQEFRDMSMMEMVACGLRANGHTVPSGRNHHATLQAAFSTGSVSALYEQTIGSMAIQAYMESGDFSQGWTTTNEELNLEEHSRPRLESAPDLTIQPETGTADSTGRSATAEKVKVDRFSRQAEIDEIAFINDNFSLLRQTPIDFGRAAARLRPTLVASVLLANAAMSDTVALFHASHVNLITGSALSQANLQKARAQLGKQKDGDASLNLPATHLIVPTDLGDLALQLTRSALISNDSGAGSMNSLAARNITPIEEARLANGVTDPRSKTALAGSATTYYLVSAEGHTIEVQFLAGTGQVPVVVVTQLTGGKFGLNITVKHFVGAKALDWRSMMRITA